MLKSQGIALRNARRLAVLIVALVAGAMLAGRVPASRADSPPLGPIDPNHAEQTLINLANKFSATDILSALNNTPVPYVVCIGAGTAPTTCVNQKAGSPTRFDADQSKTTGQGGGGQDIQVEVHTELTPTPHLRLNINRLGAAPFASNLQVAVAFPFAAFNGEPLLAPNLFFGYRTTSPFNGTVYPAGGSAPATVQYLITPHLLGGANHVLDLQINTTGALNPVQFLGGHFDGTSTTGVQNVLGIAALADPVPASMTYSMDVAQNLFSATPTTTNSQFGLSYSASSPAKIIFDYLENEQFPFVGGVPDFQTQVTFDQMPTSEQLAINVDFAARTLTLSHDANAPIGKITLEHKRRDGLTIKGVATQVPTSVDLTLTFNPSVTIDVNGNTMDIEFTATQDGGFPGSNALFGHVMRFFHVKATDIADVTASYDGPTQNFALTTPNPGEFIGSLAFVIDDDAGSIDDPVIEFPPDQTSLGTGVGEPWDDPNRHIFSFVDDGTHGTAAARLIGVDEASLTLSSGSLADVGEKYVLTLAAPKPLTAYVNLEPAAVFLPASITDLEATCNIHDFPMGTVDLDLQLPPPSLKFTFSTIPAGQSIDDIFCAGNVNSLFFELVAGDVPAGIDFTFTPADNALPDAQGSLVLTTPTPVGKLGVRLWAPTGDTLDDNGFSTSDLLGVALDDARFLANTIPDVTATWSDGANTNISFTTPGAGEPSLGGLQVGVSTIQKFASQFPTPNAGTEHYGTLIDKGGVLEKTLKAGAFGIDTFTYTSDADSLAVHYAADIARLLTVDVESNFGGHFFEDYSIDAVLTVDKVPQTFDFSTNMRTQLDYTASSGIAAIDVNGDVDDSNNAIDDRTTVDFDADVLPQEIHFLIDPATGASLTLVGPPIDLVSLELSSNVGIFGSSYKHILGSVEDIPTSGWTAAWGTVPNLHASLNAGAPLGPISVILSKDIKANTPSKYDPFTVAGGAVTYTAFAREVDRRYFRQGSGDDDVRETTFMSRLDGLYNSTSQLDPGEDHLIIRDDSKFISVRGTGFQCLSAQVGPGSFQCVADGSVAAGEANASVLIPVAGVHPFYVGIEDSPDKFLTVQVPDVPDSTSAVAGTARFNLDFSGSAGDILIYKGPLPSVGDFTDALKVQLINTPSFIHATWDLGFPGGIHLDTSGVLEVRLLTQNGSERTVVDFGAGDLAADWGIDVLEVEGFECKEDLGPIPPFFAECGTWLTIVGAHATFSASPAIEGFVANYTKEDSPSALSTDPPAMNGSEYVPRLHLLVDNLDSISGSASIDVCVVPLPLPVPCVAPGVLLPHIGINVSGDFNFDFWDLGGGPLDFLGDPDYVDSNPWDLFPIFHSQDDHLFPFGP